MADNTTNHAAYNAIDQVLDLVDEMNYFDMVYVYKRIQKWVESQ